MRVIDERNPGPDQEDVPTGPDEENEWPLGRLSALTELCKSITAKTRLKAEVHRAKTLPDGKEDPNSEWVAHLIDRYRAGDADSPLETIHAELKDGTWLYRWASGTKLGAAYNIPGAVLHVAEAMSVDVIN
jgi:hypothetical protein